MVKVSKEKIEIDFSILEEYCKAVDKTINNLDNTFIVYKDGKLTLYSEDKIDGMSVGSSVFLELDTEGEATPFLSGIETKGFLALVKKLYEGTIKMDFSKSKVVIKEDNIKASFGKIAGKKYYNSPEFISLADNHRDWVMERLTDCLSSISETAKKHSDNKFMGILFDTGKGITRVCKFTAISLYLSTAPAVFANDFRMVFPDIIARLTKSFKGSVKSILLADTQVGLELKSGTRIWTPKPIDNYPKDYLSHLGLLDGSKLLPEIAPYIFDVNSLVNAIDLVSVVLGDTDSWVSFETVGKSADKMVWRISGKNYKGVEIHEDVLSTDGDVVQKFGVNKDRALKALTLFNGDVKMSNLSASTLAFAGEDGDRVSLLVKTRI